MKMPTASFSRRRRFAVSSRNLAGEPSSVKMLLERAEQLALLENDNAMSK
jgi:hypothetical protein